MATNHPPLMITERDYESLAALVGNTKSEAARLLEEELHRATVISAAAVPGDLVTMNSTVRFKDLATGQETEVTLVFPGDSDIEKGRVSVLAPMGSALIGLRVNQVIGWPLPSGSIREIQVTEILSHSGTNGRSRDGA